MKTVSIASIIVFLLACGLAFGSGATDRTKAPNAVVDSTPTQVAAYVSLPQTVKFAPAVDATSAVVTIPTNWKSSADRLNAALQAAADLVNGFKTSANVGVAVGVTLPSQKNETPNIVIRDFSIAQVPPDTSKPQPTFAFSLIVPDVAVDSQGLQQFPNGFTIQMTTNVAPDGVFILSPDKKLRVYLKDLKPKDNPLHFDGEVTHEGDTWTIKVTQWLPGDPCMGG